MLGGQESNVRLSVGFHSSIATESASQQVLLALAACQTCDGNMAAQPCAASGALPAAPLRASATSLACPRLPSGIINPWLLGCPWLPQHSAAQDSY